MSINLLNNAKNISHMKMFFGDKREAKSLFQGLPFHNAPTEKPYIKRFNNIQYLT